MGQKQKTTRSREIGTHLPIQQLQTEKRRTALNLDNRRPDSRMNRVASTPFLWECYQWIQQVFQFANLIFNNFSRLLTCGEGIRSRSILFLCPNHYNFEVDPNNSAMSNYQPDFANQGFNYWPYFEIFPNWSFAMATELGTSATCGQTYSTPLVKNISGAEIKNHFLVKTRKRIWKIKFLSPLQLEVMEKKIAQS